LDFGAARPLMRFFITVRSAIAEAKLAEAVKRGTRQIVVLGAGLDTLSVRNPFPQATIYEIDHPATQAWKQQRLSDAGMAPGANVRFVPVNFEHDTLEERLAEAGFDRQSPAFFVWLGVVPYLTDAAVFTTLRYVASIRDGETVFDYPNPIEQLAPEAAAAAKARAKRVAQLGEPFISAFDTGELHERLTGLGALAIDDFGPVRLAQMYGREAPNDAGGHVVHVRFKGRLDAD
jgi:methyltransferase (TIGR00027 family)